MTAAAPTLAASGYRGQRVGVFGMGRSGLAAARALALGGAIPVCWDDRDAGRDAARSAGFEVEDLTDPTVARSLFKLVLSPGAAHLYPTPHAAAAAALAVGAPIDNDIGLFFETVAALNDERRGKPPHRVVAITGSNGKSTTTALATHLLQAAGFAAEMAGNIGRGVFDLAPPEPGGVTVLELSSYQTDVARFLEPDVAVFLNLQADHLDRHAGLGGYFAAKARLFEARGKLTAIIGVDEPEGAWLANRLEAPWRRERLWRVVGAPARLQRRGHEALAGAGRLTLLHDGVGEVFADLAEAAPALPGDHNAQNIAAAVLAGLALGARAAALRDGLKSFAGLAHRLQRVAEIAGVVFVNDSKATNVDAAEKALKSYDKIRWILGGRAKAGGGLARLAPATGSVRKAYLIGECSDAFAAELGALGLAHERCETMARAVERAAAEAEPGDAVLLSPAAASFDQYPDFEARGRDFVAAVERLAVAGA